MIETINITIQQLCEAAENNKEAHDINSALGEFEISGHTYQIQLSLIANKNLWCGKNEVRFSEVVKIHQ